MPPQQTMACRARRRRSRKVADQRAADRDRGFSTLEAVLVIPVVVIVTMIVVQYVLLWHARNVTQAAARDGLRVARGYQSSVTQGKIAAEQYLATVAPTLLAHRTCDVRRGPTTVVILCRATVSSVIPFGSFSVTEQATGPVEVFEK